MNRSVWLERFVVFVALAISVWGLGSFGLWDPWELDATAASDFALSMLGPSELAARLPNALGGLALCALAFVVLRGSGVQHAGLIALAVLVSTPMFQLNARLAMGGALGMAAQAWVGISAIAASQAPTGRTPRAGAFALVGAAALVSAWTSGVLLGPLPPLLAVAVWQWVGEPKDEHPSAHWVAPATAALLLGGVIHAVVQDSPEPSVWLGGGAVGGEPPTWDGALELVFHGFAPWSAALPLAALSVMAPRPARSQRTQRLAWLFLLWLAFGFVSWTVFASRYGTPPFLALLPLAGLVALWLGETLDGTETRWPAAVVVALLIGLVVRDYALYPDSPLRAVAADGLSVPEVYRPTRHWAAWLTLSGVVLCLSLVSPQGRARPNDRRTVDWLAGKWNEGWPRRGWMVAAASLLASCVVFGAMCFVLDLRIASIVVRVGRYAFFAPLLFVALVFGLPWLSYGFSRLGRARVPLVLLAALSVGAFTALSFEPALSHHFSQKSVFESYEELSRSYPGPLASYRVSTSASHLYTDAPIERIDTQGSLLDYLTEGGQRWVILETDALPRVNRAYRRATSTHLYVADASGARLLLASALPVEGRPNESFLARAVLEEAPALQHVSGTRFDDDIELLGYELDLPEGDSVGAGQQFSVTWYWKVLGKPPHGYKVFVHIDGNGLRLNGDHEPVGERYPTKFWDEGDIVADSQTLTVPPNFRPGDYTIHIGFFSGSKRLEVSSGPNDGENRARAGVLPVR